MKLVGSTGDTGVAGVFGQSRDGDGVSGLTYSDYRSGVSGVADLEHGKGIFGQSAFGTGVFGKSSSSGRGVVGVSNNATAVEGNSTNGAGIWGSSLNGEGLHGETNSLHVAAIAAFNLNPNGTGAALYAKKVGNNGVAGFFEGHVEITGEIRMSGADFAEDFDVIAESESGEVMVLTDQGILERCSKEYDKKVVGVLSGAGNYKPGIVLDKHNSGKQRKPIALVGKVYCKVDADTAPIEEGDLLTTSGRPGHAMKAGDPFKAFGAVIGKAMGSLQGGQGLIPMLVILH